MIGRAMVIAGAAVLLAMRPGGELDAQVFGTTPLPGEDVASVAVHFGAVDPRTTFYDESTFERGTTVGVSATGWAFRYLGFRGSVFRSQNDGTNPVDPNAAIAVQDPTVWLYNGEVVLRYPVVTDAAAFFPTVSAGFGGKTWIWEVKTFGDVFRAWTQGVGLEIRPQAMGRVGFITELKHYRSEFKVFNYQPYFWFEASTGKAQEDTDPDDHLFGIQADWGEMTHHSDLVLTAGISVNF